MKDTETAALICRVSTREQEEGYSLDAQELLLRDHCAKFGLKVQLVRAFSETASKYDQRKKFLEFVGDVRRAGLCHIVAEKVDRVSRSGSRDAVLIDTWVEEDQDRHLHLVKQSLDIHKFAPSTAKFVWNMHVAVAKHTSDNLSEEVRKTADVMLSRGIWPTGALVGYVRDRANAVCPVQPDPAKAHLVRTMFDLYDSGSWSVARLSEKMQELGLRNGNGHKIVASRIHKLLQDPFYIGKMRYRGKIWEAVHEPLVRLDVFERVQSRLRRSAGGAGATLYSKHDHLLAGIFTCGNCGKRLTWEAHGHLSYGYCKRYGACASRAAIAETAAEEALMPYLGRLAVQNRRLADWISGALRDAGLDDVALKAAARRVIEDDIRRITQKLDRLLDLRLDGDLGKDEYDERRGQFLSDKGRLTAALRTQDIPASAGTNDPANVYEAGRHFAERYAQAEPAERKTIAREIFSGVVVTGKSITVSYTRPYQLLSKAVAVTNSSKVSENDDFPKMDFEKLKNGSDKQKDQAFGLGHPVWLAAWDEFRAAIAEMPYHNSSQEGLNES